MTATASQITSLTIVYLIVYSGTDKRKHQSSASLAFVRGIHRGPVNSPHKGPVTRKMFPFDDVIIPTSHYASAIFRPWGHEATIMFRPGNHQGWTVLHNSFLLFGLIESTISNQYFINGPLACCPGFMAINFFFVVFCCGDINIRVYILYFLANLKQERSLKMINMLITSSTS